MEVEKQVHRDGQPQFELGKSSVKTVKKPQRGDHEEQYALFRQGDDRDLLLHLTDQVPVSDLRDPQE